MLFAVFSFLEQFFSSSTEFLCLLANQNVTFVTLFCSKLPFFCTVLPKNYIPLSQSQSRNFFMYIIMLNNDLLLWCPLNVTVSVSSPSSSSFSFFFFTKDERGFAPRTEKVLNENNQKETETKEISGKRL